MIIQSSRLLNIENDMSDQCLHDPGVVDSKELVCGSYHIHSIRLALGSLFIKELINRFFFRSILKIYFHDLK